MSRRSDSPRRKKRTVKGRRAVPGSSDGSTPRDHCQSKYWKKLATWWEKGAIRSVSGGFWYCSRRRLAASAGQPAAPFE